MCWGAGRPRTHGAYRAGKIATVAGLAAKPALTTLAQPLGTPAGAGKFLPISSKIRDLSRQMLHGWWSLSCAAATRARPQATKSMSIGRNHKASWLAVRASAFSEPVCNQSGPGSPLPVPRGLKTITPPTRRPSDTAKPVPQHGHRQSAW